MFVHIPSEIAQQKYIYWILINSFELQILTSQEVKKKKKIYWLSMYAIKFSSINILIRVPGNSSLQGAQLRNRSCLSPQRQNAWELKQFVSVHQAAPLPKSNK